MSKTESINCDICGKLSNQISSKIQVIFETEQNEGRASSPYLQMVDIDLCSDCRTVLLNGNYIFATGAMGHNKYYFKEK